MMDDKNEVKKFHKEEDRLKWGLVIFATMLVLINAFNVMSYSNFIHYYEVENLNFYARIIFLVLFIAGLIYNYIKLSALI